MIQKCGHIQRGCPAWKNGQEELLSHKTNVKNI